MRIIFFTLLAGGYAFAQHETVLRMHGDRVPLHQIQSRSLHSEMNRLRDVQVAPKTGTGIVFDDTAAIVAVELERDGHPNDLLYGYFLEKTPSPLYLHGRMNEKGRPELRLWSDGDSEILITEEKMVLETQPSAVSFRTTPQAAAKDRDRALETTDVIRCLAQALGINLNLSSIQAVLTSS